MRGVIARLLHLANADVGGAIYRQEFYAMKERILRRFGAIVGEDVQRFRKECWGYDEWVGCTGQRCGKCGGTGVWYERWVLLERWEFCGYVFHRPVGPTQPRAVGFIDGRITHRDIDRRDSQEAMLWLALLFDRGLFWRALRSSRTYGLTWRRPMLCLQAFVSEVRKITGAFYLRRCDSCARRWVFRYAPRSFLCRISCRRCEETSRLAFATILGGEDDDLPF